MKHSILAGVIIFFVYIARSLLYYNFTQISNHYLCLTNPRWTVSQDHLDNAVSIYSSLRYNETCYLILVFNAKHFVSKILNIITGSGFNKPSHYVPHIVSMVPIIPIPIICTSITTFSV